jgi:CDP-glycerol glycerophosphotransferase (TagB/SpsB family)
MTATSEADLTAETAASRFARTSVTHTVSHVACAAGALLAGYLSLAGVPDGIFVALLLAVLAWYVFGLWTEHGQLGHRAVVRTLAAASVATSFTSISDIGDDTGAVAAAFACLTIPIMLESILARATASRVDFVANVPGVVAAGRMPQLGRPAVTASAVAIGLGAAFSYGGSSGSIWLPAAVLVDLFYLCITFIAVRRIRKNTILNRDLGEAVDAYRPEFIVYTSRPDDASYQILMWLPYLQRTGRRFIIVTRNIAPAVALAEQTDAPVIARVSVAELEEILTPSVRAVFYVNASSGNATMVRYQEFTHVYLGHGDSDKPPSYNPLHAMFDAIFAAGPAATRRYGAHGVTIESDKFEIVGRPQLESVERSTDPIANIDSPTVFYAPTWRGHVDETMLYSLPQGPAIVEQLLQRGARVIFRAHPFSYQFDDDTASVESIHRLLAEDRMRTGRDHLFGAAAESDRDVVECANLSDAMISDVSSVVSDYLYSGKPFAMVAVSADGEEFVDLYPIAQAAYVLEADLGNLNNILDQLLGSDPLQQRRLDLRADYLGDFPADGYADHFVFAVDRMISKPQRDNEPDQRGNALDTTDSIDEAADTEVTPAESSSDEAESSLAEAVVPGEAGESEQEEALGPVSWTSTLARLRKKVAGRTLIPSGFAVAAFILLIVSAPVFIVATLGLLGSLVHLFHHRRALTGRRRPTDMLRVISSARALLAGTFGLAWIVTYGWSWLIVAASLILAVSIASETGLQKAWRVTGLEARNIPDVDTRGYQPVDRGFVAVTSSAATALCWIFTYFGAVALDPFILSLVPFGLAVILYSAGIVRGIRSARLDAQLPALMDDYGAEFAAYFGSNMGIGYQLRMWLPYLQRMGRRFIIVTRDIQMMRAAGRMTRAPVINRPTLRSLEDVISPSLKTAFYVNNAGLNTHFIERREMTHVWLNHGDSEKPACYNPVHAIYDYIFAAGQAGIDRYERHSVDIATEKFRIVGRPQVEGIHRRKSPIATIDDKTVLYAPTWKGPYKDTEVYSLPRGEEIVQALLDRDCTVIFRAHSLNYQFPEAKAAINHIQTLLSQDREHTGRRHVWGARAERKMSLTSCFNASDAMISDVSAVITDYLQSDKPFSIVSVGRSVSELADDAPASAASYVIHGDLANLDNALDQLLHTDPLSASRDRMRKYYLGDFNARHYADAFVDAATDVIDERAAADEAAQAVTHLPRQTGTELPPNATTQSHEFSQTANCAVAAGKQSDGVLPEDR